MRRNRQNQTGFTLVELLIVIAIIATLLSILLPSIQYARALTRQAVCKVQLRGQAQAHALYGFENDEFKPPLMVRGHTSVRADWVSPRIKWSDKPVGQGILVTEGRIQLDMLYCPSASMQRDRKLDRAAWRDLRDAGCSYAYFWRHPSGALNPAAPGRGATYQEAIDTHRTALSMDINCETGHSYTGDYEGRDWPSHPAVGKVNVAYIDGGARSFNNDEVRLMYPGGEFEELQWFDKAHGRESLAPEPPPARRRAFGR